MRSYKTGLPHRKYCAATPFYFEQTDRMNVLPMQNFVPRLELCIGISYAIDTAEEKIKERTYEQDSKSMKWKKIKKRLPGWLAGGISTTAAGILFYQKPELYGGMVSPELIPILYSGLLLAVWLSPAGDICRKPGGLYAVAVNLAPLEWLFGLEAISRAPLLGAGLLLVWLLLSNWFLSSCLDRELHVIDDPDECRYWVVCEQDRKAHIRFCVLTGALLLLLPSLWAVHQLRAEHMQMIRMIYQLFFYQTDPGFLVDLTENSVQSI